MHALFVVICF